MRSLKALGLMLVVNILIMITLMISANILVYIVLPMIGINVQGVVGAHLFVFALVFGFGGAFISLMFSKTFARMGMRMQQVTNPQTPKEALVYKTVAELAERANIQMPEVWVYWSDEPNAFATGPSRNNSMVAVSSGLVNLLDDQEVKAVLAHEMGHIDNGDMLATTLLQGLMNTFVMWIAWMVAQWFHDENGNPTLVSFAVSMGLQIALSILALIPITWHSRQREFRADKYAAEAYGSASMKRALNKIHAHAERLQVDHSVQNDALATARIEGNWQGLFATHPPLEKRIQALEEWDRNRR